MRKLLAVLLYVVACATLIFCGLQLRGIWKELQKSQKIEFSVNQNEKSAPRKVSCKWGIVEWSDAVIRAKAPDEFEQAFKENTPLLASCVSIGCICERKEMKEIVVISGFSDGKPDDFITIPDSWVRKISYLTVK